MNTFLNVHTLVMLLSGMCVALTAGPLGTFVAWQRLAYIGDALAHAGFLGFGLALLWHCSTIYTVGVVAGSLGVATLWLQNRQGLGTDTILGILSQSGLAIGLLLLSKMPDAHEVVEQLLYGDLSTVNVIDLYWLIASTVLIVSLICYGWRSLLFIVVHPDLAKISGISVSLWRYLFVILLAVWVALAMKIVGALLVTSLLLFPAATVRGWVAQPLTMVIAGTGIALFAVVVGLLVSLGCSVSPGPTVVLILFVLFVLSSLFVPCAWKLQKQREKN